VLYFIKAISLELQQELQELRELPGQQELRELPVQPDQQELQELPVQAQAVQPFCSQRVRKLLRA